MIETKASRFTFFILFDLQISNILNRREFTATRRIITLTIITHVFNKTLNLIQ